MNSLRPLATITILIGVGVVLWMKINETEPALPEGLENWQVGSGLEIGAGSDGSIAANPLTPPAGDSAAIEQVNIGGPAPRYDAASPAPAYEPVPPENNAAQRDAGASAPAWDPSQASATAAAGESDSAELPPMPDIPTMDMTAADSAAAAGESTPTTQTTSPSSETPAADEQLVMTVTPHIIHQEEEEEELLGIDAGAPPTPAEPATSQNQSADGDQPAAAVPDAPIAGVAEGAAQESVTPSPPPSLYAATRVAVQSALDRGELSRALLLLSDWYGDPSLKPEERNEVNTLLSQLAGTVIYSREPRLEPPYLVQAGETLDAISEKFNVPPELLARINGLSRAEPLRPGTQLKVLRGPFSAVIDVSGRDLTLMLDGRYAGRFNVELEPDCTVQDGHWVIDQKAVTPSASFGGGGVDRKLVLRNPAAADGQVAVISGPEAAGDAAAGPACRAIRVQGRGIDDVFGILSIGSRVTIRR